MQQVPPAYERVDQEEDDKNGEKTNSKKRKAHGSELYDNVD